MILDLIKCYIFLNVFEGMGRKWANETGEKQGERALILSTGFEIIRKSFTLMNVLKYLFQKIVQRFLVAQYSVYVCSGGIHSLPLGYRPLEDEKNTLNSWL